MISSQQTPMRDGPTRSSWLAVLILLSAAAAGIVALSPVDLLPDTTAPAQPVAAGSSAARRAAALLPSGHDGRAPRSQPTSVSGEVAAGGGGTVLDDSRATVAKLDPALLEALRTAATAALDDGVELRVTSGWRSAAYQEQLLEEAITEYGSEKEAKRWVATPETSEHVSGDAVDIGPSKAAMWLERHGAAYGLCRVYRNEPWHFELRQGAALDGCPAMYADPTQDPRMSR